MWYLENERDASFKLSLPVGRELIVGRKDCDVLIPNDKSISRKHALIRVDNRTRSSPLFLTDCESKFGTHLGKRKLSPGEQVQLCGGEEIKFGQGPTSGNLRIVFEPFVLCCSSMPSAEKREVSQLVKELGGRMSGNWTTECSHLVMSSLTVTVKVVCALASCRPIITIAWLRDAVASCRDNKALPKPTKYMPTVVDEEVRKSDTCFSPNFKRRTLFQDRVFYFFNQSQMASLQVCLSAAGAQCKLINKPRSVPVETLVVKESIVVGLKDDLGSSDEIEWAEEVNDFLVSRDMRSIAEPEVGFALLHISIETYCNPKSKEGGSTATISMAPPSLSQMVQTQSTQSQAGPAPSQARPPHSLTPSQIKPTPSQSILAPNTCSSLSTQQSSNSTQTKMADGNQSKTSRISETPPHPKCSNEGQSAAKINNSVPDKSRRSKSDVIPKTMTNQKLTDFIKPTQPVLTRTTQAKNNSKKIRIERKIMYEDTNDDEEVVDNSQSDSQETNSKTNSSKKLPGLSLKRNTPTKKSRIHYQSQEDVLSESVKSNQSAQDLCVLGPSLDSNEKKDPGKSQSSQNVSVLALNSLTPGSTQRKRSDSNALPGASLMNELFQGRGRKKRKVDDVCDESIDESQPKKSRKESQSTAPRDDRDGENIDGKRNSILIDDSPPKLKCLDDDDEHTNQLEVDKVDSESEVRSKLPSRASNTQLTPRPLATSTQAAGRKTPAKKIIKVSPIASTTSFLSTRKRRKIETESEMSTIPALSFSEAADQNASLFADTQAALTGKDWLTPFTKLATSEKAPAPTSIFTTTGKRSKVNPRTEADALWKEEGVGGEGENPLGTQYEDPSQSKKYKPVLSGDGFILPRAKPTVESSKMGRFARMAKSEYLRSPGSPEGMEVGEGSEETHPPISYHVEVVSLVITAGSGRKKCKGVRSGRNGRLRNFKKFNKVQNAGGDCLPSFPALARYVPPSSSELLDWTVVDEQRNSRDAPNRDSESEEESQSQNIFTLPKSGRRRIKK